MKKVSIIVIALIAIGLVTLFGAFIWWNNALSAPSSNNETTRVVITKGASGEKIAQTLEEAGVIKNALAFKFYLQLNDVVIPTGQFDVPQNLSVAEIVEVLQKGPTQVWVTVREGLRHEELPEIFVESLGLTGTEATAFVDEFLVAAEDEEGFLFPDTYLLPPDATASQAVSLMRNTFDQKFPQAERIKLSSLGLNLNEAVTLASLLERETLTAEERPIVAGILYNRLDEGMPLQIDATVQYALASENCKLRIENCVWWPQNLTRDQIQNTRSPYNTYLNTGIPPAPIANPGLTSLMAIANPEETNYFYYIHADGQIYYGRTLEEHNANVARYLR